ncbi:MAG: transcriptional regulator [Armatimonadetes bacterium]|nr:transcriptional regulator [Armatimonadota bacterium]
MRTSPLIAAKSKTKELGAFFKPRELRRLSISFRTLQQLVSAGEVEKIAPGLYRRAEVEPTEHETVAMVCSAIPNAIVCLLSALSFYEIGTQIPRNIWIALDRKSRIPKAHGLPVRIVRFSGPMLRYGITTRELQGVPVRITSPARTVVDCFRYRNKIGLDVAMEALHDSIRSRTATVDEIVRAADVCRARTVIQPYLEALSI